MMNTELDKKIKELRELRLMAKELQAEIGQPDRRHQDRHDRTEHGHAERRGLESNVERIQAHQSGRRRAAGGSAGRSGTVQQDRCLQTDSAWRKKGPYQTAI